MKVIATLAALTVVGALPAMAQEQVLNAPPPTPFAKVSELVPLPDFLPGLGQLWVDPATLPAGPFLGYDREGRLVATIYMVPIDDLEAGTNFDNLANPAGTVDHVDVYYNAGHPGVEEPHAHVVLWHVAIADEARVAE
jgi:hypothetical protein